MLPWSPRAYAVAVCPSAIKEQHGTGFSLLVSGPMFSRRSADSNFPALSVPLRRLAVGGGLAIPQLVGFSSDVDCIHSVEG